MRHSILTRPFILTRHFILPLLFALFVPGALLADTPDKFTLANPSFETEDANGVPNGWRADSRHYNVVTEEARTGNACLRWRDDASGYFICRQRTKLKGGDYVAFSAWVKSKDLKNGSPQICLEWMKDGKVDGGAYNPVHLSGTVGQWSKIGGVASVPEGIDYVELLCFVTDGASGTAWFDDVELSRPDSPLFSAITTDRYRHEFVAETIRVYAGISPAFKEYPIAPVRSSALPARSSSETTRSENRVERENGLNRNESNRNETNGMDLTLTVFDASKKAILTLQPKQYAKDYAQFELDAGRLVPGRYTFSCRGRNPVSGKIETAELVATRCDTLPERKCAIDRYRRLVLDGKLFFPLGIYTLNLTKDDCRLLSDSGFNAVLPYVPPKREQLDEAQAHGLRVVYSIGNKITGGKTPGAKETVSDALAELKGHSAIIAWYINDEMPLTRMTELVYRRRILEELDPDRPTYSVLCQSNEIRFYLPSLDVVGTDPYPISKHPAAMTAEWARRTRIGTFESRAMWQVPQLFNWCAHRYAVEQKKEYRAPTFVEIRGMAWMSIAEGANGLFFYSLHSLRHMDKTLAEGGQALVREPFDQRWKDVAAMAREIAQWNEVLLKEPSDMTLVPDPHNAPDVLTRAYGTRRDAWFLLVNSGREHATVSYTLPDGARLVESKMGPNATQKRNVATVTLGELQPCFLHIAVE